MKIWTVDAFTNKPFSGNPAAVTIVQEFPSDALCQDIAAEMNLSETAFIKPLGRDHFHIRWFTPSVEVQLCGHATLASAHILFQEKMVEGARFHFESLSGPLFIRKESDKIVLDFPLQRTCAALHFSLFEALFDPDNAKVVYKQLKESPLYDSSTRQWNWSMTKTRELRVSNREVSAQLLGILVEAKLKELFDKEPLIKDPPLPPIRSF